MCRILGVWDFKHTGAGGQLEKVVARMRDTMAYGGPDDAGIQAHGGLVLAHRRLSILDLSSSGHQPMQWRSYTIVYNGEIYNYQEIRKELKRLGYKFATNTDTEVILKGYHHWGKEVVSRFRGMFAFAIYDAEIQKLVLCRDRIGVKPLYWYWKDGLFMFSSELKAFHQHPLFDKSINHDAIALYLQQGYIHAPYCVFRYAHKLKGGNFLEISHDQQISISNYWDVSSIYENSTVDTRSEEVILEELEQVLLESFRLRLVADVPVGMFLSGGIDSSLVVALLQRSTNRQLKTFTIGFWNEARNEAPFAKKVARHLGTNHTEFYCSEEDFKEILPSFSSIYDEPFGDSSGIPTYLLAQIAREQVKVSLSADGGDELFGGYTKYEIAKNIFPKLQYIPRPIRKIISNLDTGEIARISARSGLLKNYTGVHVKMQKLLNAIDSKHVIGFFNASSQFLNNKKLSNYTNNGIRRESLDKFAYEKDRLLTVLGVIDMNTYLEGDIMCKVDRATMQFGMEGREPFLDHHLVDFALRLPDHLKLRGKQGKYLLRQILYKYLPSDIIDRPKQGFAIPLKDWLHTILREELLELAHDEEFFFAFQLKSTTGDLIKDFLTNKRYVAPDLIWFLYNLKRWKILWL